MQGLWQDMSQKLEQQQQLTDRLIMEMTQQKYRSKFSSLYTFETLGAVICYGCALGILLFINRLDTWYLMASGIVCVLILIVLPIFSLGAIKNMQRLNLKDNNYKDTLTEFAVRKRRFMQFQQLNIGLTPIFMLFSLPVMTSIIKGKDLFLEGTALFWFVPIASIFLIFFYRWVFKCYKNIGKSAEALIKELKD